MRLVWHQMRKDARQFRWQLLAWALLLGVDLAANHGWAGRPGWQPDLGGMTYESQWVQWVQIALWFLLALLPASVVLADPPAQTNGFLATRPMPRRDLLLAKVLWVMGGLLLPLLLQEAVHLALLGHRASHILRAVGERAGIALPVVLTSAGFAALWRSPQQFRLALLGAVGLSGLFGIGLALFQEHQMRQYGQGSMHRPDYVSVAGTLIWLAGAFLALAAANLRWALATWQRLVLGVVALLVGVTLLMVWPFRWFEIQPVDQARVEALAPSLKYDFSGRRLQISHNRSNLPQEKESVGFSTHPKVTGLPADWVMDWSNEASVWQVGNTRVPLRYPNLGSQVFMTSQVNRPEDLRAAAQSLAGTLIWDRLGGLWQGGNSSYLGYFRLDPDSPLLSAPGTLRLDLQGHLFRWEKVLDLAVNAGARQRNDTEGWHILDFSQRAQRPLQIFLEHRCLRFFTSPDARLRETPVWPADQLLFLCYDPARQVLYPPQSNHPRRLGRSDVTAAPREYLQLEFPPFRGSEQDYLDETEGPVRLVVWRKVYQGKVKAGHTVENLVLRDYAANPGSRGDLRDSQLTLAEFQRRLGALPRPATNAPRQEVGLFLYEYLRLAGARTLDQEDLRTLGRQLAPYVPGYAEAFLGGCANADDQVQRLLVSALGAGLLESQKPALARALPRIPCLCEVVVQRGWEKDAAIRDALRELARLPQSLPEEAVQALLALEDPALHARLLQDFELDLSLRRYEQLRPVPGLAAALPVLVNQLWQDRTPILHNPADLRLPPILRVALRQGHPEALPELWRIWRLLPSGNRTFANQLFETLRTEFSSPELVGNWRYDQRKLVAWMDRHRPEDFQFEPVARRYVQKQPAR
jgi:hypothetical protein